MSSRHGSAARVAHVATLLAAGLVAAAPASAQETGTRAAIDAIRVPPLRFEPPEPEVHEVAGVTVLFLRDATVPLVDVMALFKGGYARFPRTYLAAGTALSALLRYGGTRSLPPDSVDRILDQYALSTTFGGAGDNVFATVNTLSEHLPTALALWGSMLREPRFDSAEVEVWRGRELEGVRRRSDDPGRLAFSAFNHLLYGDHPVGWEMEAGDLAPEALTPERLRFLHERIVCRENLVLGVTGDATWVEVRPLLEELLGGWPACAEPLPPPPEPRIREGGGVFVIPRAIEQSVLVMAHPTEVNLGDDDYFAAQIGNTLLGAGGFSSRLMARVRTESGYAYSASSLWTTPRRYKGLVGAVTRTRPENTVAALNLILETLEEVRTEPPEATEVGTAVDQIANGFVFNFETAGQIVSRRMSFMVQELPEDWLTRYLDGVQRVTPETVLDVFRRHLRPTEMTILVVGDPDRMDMEALGRIGPVTLLETPPL